MSEDINWSENKIKDDDGDDFVCLTLELPGQPVTVKGGGEGVVYRRQYQTTLPYFVYPNRIWTFIGLDRGDIVEVELNIESHGVPLVQQSIHKETLGNYDAWRCHNGVYLPAVRDLVMVMSCRVNGDNAFGELSARVHYGLRIVGDKKK